MKDTMEVSAHDYSYGNVTISNRALGDLITCSVLEFGVEPLRVIENTKRHADFWVHVNVHTEKVPQLVAFVREQLTILLGQDTDVTINVVTHA